MKLNLLETHDRYQHFVKQNFSIEECCQDLINKRPFGDHPFYIFAHARTEDDNPGVKRLIWQPRLTKPKAQTNSMLFKAYPGTDKIKVIWMIPARELWAQYKKGNITQNQTIFESIERFQSNKNSLEEPEIDDLTEETIKAIYRQIALNNSTPKLLTSVSIE
jgi:hypothetical protein